MDDAHLSHSSKGLRERSTSQGEGRERPLEFGILHLSWKECLVLEKLQQWLYREINTKDWVNFMNLA